MITLHKANRNKLQSSILNQLELNDETKIKIKDKKIKKNDSSQPELTCQIHDSGHETIITL
jgi:hypothetical protein